MWRDHLQHAAYLPCRLAGETFLTPCIGPGKSAIKLIRARIDSSFNSIPGADAWKNQCYWPGV